MPRMPTRWAVAEIVLDLLEGRGGFERLFDAVTFDSDVQCFARILADDALHVGKTLDMTAIDRHDQVAGLEAGGGGGTVRLHRIDPRAHRLLAVKHEDTGENHDRQYEIRNRSGDDDGRPLGHGLKHEALRPLARIQGGGVCGAVGRAGDVVVAEKLDKAAERDRGNLPARAVAIIEPDELGAEPDREHQNPDAAPARDNKMSKFVKENDKTENEQKGNAIGRNPTPERIHMRQHTGPHQLFSRPRCLVAGPDPRMPLRQFRARGSTPSFSKYGQWRRLPQRIGGLP